MRTVSYRIDDLKKAVIHIGHVAENECTRVQIDAGDVYAEYPSAAVSLTVQPPAGEAFPAVVTRDGNMVIWDVKDSALTDNGMGEIQLTFISGETVVKSCIGRISVSRSIVGEGEAPDPLEDFLAEAGAALTAIPETIDTALAEAKASGEFDGPPGADGKDGADGRDGADGFSPTAMVTKSGKTATITITDKNGTTTETVSDGEDGDPTTLIDDTSTAENKVWSASKTNELKSAIEQKADIKDSNKTDVEFDLSDGDGYVLLRIKDGHIITPNFNSEYAITTTSLESSLSGINITNRLKGVKWDALGDSLTDPSTVGNSHKNYTKWISEKNGMSLNNCGVGGKGYWQGIEDEVQNVRSDTDIVTIFGSLNDIGNYTTNPGNPTDTWAGGYNTYCARARRVFDALLAVKTGIRIGVILPTPWVNYNPYDTASATQTDVENMLKSLSDICKIYGIPVLDLYHNSNLRPWDSTFRTAYYVAADGYHPNEAGNKLFIAPQVEKFLLSLASTY